MKCPNCDGELVKANYRGIEVDECPQCKGKWFEVEEVDRLEDQVMDEDELKNSMVTEAGESEKHCPVCDDMMKRFEYRWEDGLNLDMCASGHGVWMDKDEEEKVVSTMEKYRDDLIRAQNAEDNWDATVRSLGSGQWLRKLKEIMGL